MSAIITIINLIYNLINSPVQEHSLLTLMPPLPMYFTIIKSIYAVIMLFGLLCCYKKNNLQWLLINLSSIGFVSLVIITSGYYSFWNDVFLMPVISIVLLCFTNSKKYIDTFEINRTFNKAAIIFLLPLIVLEMIYYRMFLF